ncbi:SDR family NAD(P)-dependent oxidoreductase [Azospirillum halopraeferens]|uniref:SDR family NAD(P)-dependent oxidoreductase n=1 Tax=Azospirillum halopraeferens TaxID=34010 RepID=UPI0004050E27|nr:SDR family oxidoreductase [Azospirillum halopraeferens]
MELALEDRVAIVTGAGAGIGLETVRRLVREGACVVGGDLDPGALADAGPPARIAAVAVDLRDPGAGEALVRTAIARFGGVDILFNNAAAAPARDDFLAVSDADWAATLDLNLMGYVRTTRAVLPHMLKRGRGVLIHCGSEAGRMPHPLLPDYSVSKAAVLMLSKCLSRAYTSRGVRSNVVAPAHIRTALWDRPGGFLDALAARYGCGRDEAVSRFLAHSGLPAGRLGRPEEVASLVAFLASDHAAFISGEQFGIDGGVVPVV